MFLNDALGKQRWKYRVLCLQKTKEEEEEDKYKDILSLLSQSALERNPGFLFPTSAGFNYLNAVQPSLHDVHS